MVCMRMKQFIILLVVFTVVYILFFIVYDKIDFLRFQKNTKKRAFSLINLNSYLSYALFYGIQGTQDLQLLQNIYLKYSNRDRIFVQQDAPLFNISPYEFCVIISYFVYIGVMNRRTINYQGGFISSPSFNDSMLVNKYRSYFEQHDDFVKICTSVGMGSANELACIDSLMLFPGVRIVDSSIYYIGDINEKR